MKNIIYITLALGINISSMASINPFLLCCDIKNDAYVVTPLVEIDPDISYNVVYNAVQVDHIQSFDQESNKPASIESFDRPSTSLSSDVFNDIELDSYTFTTIPVTNVSTCDPDLLQYTDEPQTTRDIDELMITREIRLTVMI